ncbi:MAG: hypothetical protein Q7R43_05780 [Candidatus Daviesbacteria bacterium]|nr:hypothetical protein [Candidatus Daviesbacteria bacterium]
MGNFDRDRGDRNSRSGGARTWERRGPVEMHQAVCDNCGKSCEVPFRPTSGKPIFCSSCFEQKGSDSRPRRYDDRGSRSNDPKSMFDAVCDECGKSCQVPFQPSSGKPIYCSNCFGEKKGAGNRENNQSQNKNEFEQLNSKLDKILAMLAPKEVKEIQVEEQQIDTEKKVKVAKKKPSNTQKVKG